MKSKEEVIKFVNEIMIKSPIMDDFARHLPSDIDMKKSISFKIGYTPNKKKEATISRRDAEKCLI